MLHWSLRLDALAPLSYRLFWITPGKQNRSTIRLPSQIEAGKVMDVSGRGVSGCLMMPFCEGRPALAVESLWLISTSLGTFGNSGQHFVLPHPLADRQTGWLTDWLTDWWTGIRAYWQPRLNAEGKCRLSRELSRFGWQIWVANVFSLC